MKIDLKEVNERHLNDQPCGHYILDMIEELEAARLVCAALTKAREENYCNVPHYVDKALASYIGVTK
jgi:hypothetical protein